MSEEQQPMTPAVSRRELLDNQFALIDLIDMVLKAKYWMILSALAGLCIAFVYLYCKPSTYQSETEIMITTDRYSGMSGGTTELGLIQEVTGMKTYNSLANEQHILTSTPLLLEVVNELQLNIRYFSHQLIDRETGIYDVRLTYLPETDFDPNDLGLYRFDYELRPDNQISVTAEGPGIKGRVKLFEDRLINLGDTVALKEGEGSVIFTARTHKTTRLSDEEEEEEPSHQHRFIYLYSPWNRASELTNQIAVVVAESSSKRSTMIANNVSSILSISMVDVDAQRSEMVLEKLVEVYNKMTRQYLAQSNNATMDFINNRLEDLANQLSSIEGDLTAFSVNHRLIDLQSQTTSMLQTEDQTQQRYQEIAIQERLFKMVLEEITNGKPYSALPSNIGMTEGTVTQAIAEYNRLTMERSRLLAGSSESNPVVQQLNANMDARLEQIHSSINSTLAVLAQRKREMENLLGQGRAQLNSLPTQSINMAKIEREKSIIEPLYVLLQRKREETMLAIVAEPNVARVIEPAKRSSHRIGPSRNRIYLISVFLGLLFPLGIIYLLRLLKTKIESPEDISSRTRVPVLGLIPHSNATRTLASEIVANSKSSVLSEVFRTVRTNIGFLEGKVLQITSSVPGEGKSFISTNLAITLSQAGMKVVIVETDIRRGHLQRTFEISRKQEQGLSHYLCGDVADWHDIIKHPECLPELSVICKGVVPPNPNELLLSNRMKQLIEDLRTEYDYVILDSPPFLMVADPLTLNKFVDQTIYVMRNKVSHLQFCEEVERASQDNKLKSINIVLNDVNFNNQRRYGSHYGYGYGYGYSYGYGYGYGEKQRSSSISAMARLFKRKIKNSK